MLRLILHESQKMWRRKEFLFFAALRFLLIFFLLFITAGDGSDREASACRKLTQELYGQTMSQKQAYIDQLFLPY